MNFNVLPSLEYIALVKVAASLWNRKDLKFLWTHCSGGSKMEFMFSILRKQSVVQRVKTLQLPKQLEKKVGDFVEEISGHILEWIKYHKCTLEGDYLPSQFCWTPLGTVDKKKTAELLIQNEDIDLALRYKLACIYCLECDVLKLWNEMPESRKNSFCSKEDAKQMNQCELVVLWTYWAKGDVNKMNAMIEGILGRNTSCFQYTFNRAALDGNKAAVEYFLTKLSPEERRQFLVMAALSVADTKIDLNCYNRFGPNYRVKRCVDVFLFLLSQMNAEQQEEVFAKHFWEVLECLLDWPWHCLFIEAANRMWDFVPDFIFFLLVEQIADRVECGRMHHDWQNLFTEFWQQSPDSFKQKIVSNGLRRKSGSSGIKLVFFITKLVECGDKESVRQVLEMMTAEEKERIIFLGEVERLCVTLILTNKWDLAKFVVEECLYSKEVITKFKTRFVKFCAFAAKDGWLFLQNTYGGTLTDTQLQEVQDKTSQFLEYLDEVVLHKSIN